MYSNLNISTLSEGGYVVQVINPDRGSYNPYVAGFSSKTEMLKWLDINLLSKSPDLVDRRPQAPALVVNSDDEIPF